MNIVLTGGSCGLGKQLKIRLLERNHVVYDFSLTHGHDVRNASNCRAQLAKIFAPGKIQCLINCAGWNDIGPTADFHELRWDAVMDTNAKGIFNMVRAALPQLISTQGTVLNFVSNASHVPMTYSAAYNASKAAAHMLTKSLARELTPLYGITVFAISPNKLCRTHMSSRIDQMVCETRGWTAEEAQAYQRKSLLTGEETPPECVAEFATWLLDKRERHKYLSGCDIPYGV